MKPIVISRSIVVSLDLVFETVSDIRSFREAVPHIKGIEFLSDQQVGVGKRFLETREMRGREQTVELEVAQCGETTRVRMISDTGGTVCGALFTVVEDIDQVTLQVQMDIKPYTASAKLTVPLIKGVVAKAVGYDLESVKAYCESNQNLDGSS